MSDIYKEDGPTAREVDNYALAGNFNAYGAAKMLARAIDKLRDELGMDEYARLQEEARKGYKGE